MASAAGIIGSASPSSLAGKGVFRGRRQRRPSSDPEAHRRAVAGGGVRCAYGSPFSPSHSGGGALMDQYRTLRVQPGASEGEVKKAFRQLALRYHPDVCKGSNCAVQFHRINEAYDVVMSSLRDSNDDEAEDAAGTPRSAVDDSDQMRGMYDPSWDLWEEWMGFEGAGCFDYTSHINPYI